MDRDQQRYVDAEAALLASEGVEATATFVDLERLSGRARVLEAGEGPAVLMMPGVMTGGAVFAGIVGRVPGFRFIMIDKPGLGISPLLNPPQKTVADHERVGDALLVDIADGLGIDRCHVVATSQGGFTALRSVAAHPDRFDRMVGLAYLMGSPLEKLPLSMRVPSIPPLTPRRIRVTPRLVRMMLSSAGMRSAIKNGKFSDELTDYLVATFRYTDTFRNDSLHSIRPVEHPPELLARIQTPLHLFWGTDDLMAGEASAQALAAAVANTTVQMVKGAGHAPWLDEPELAAEAVRAHLSGGAASGP